jgi:hypothetical protein
MITPQHATGEAQMGGVGAIDFAITYVVEPQELESAIFFIEVKPPTHISPISDRKKAKNQVRSLFDMLVHLVRTPKLYGISAIGRNLSYFVYDRASGVVVSPALPDSSTAVMTPLLLRDGTLTSCRRVVLSSWPW